MFYIINSGRGGSLTVVGGVKIWENGRGGHRRWYKEITLSKTEDVNKEITLSKTEDVNKEI